MRDVRRSPLRLDLRKVTNLNVKEEARENLVRSLRNPNTESILSIKFVQSHRFEYRREETEIPRYISKKITGSTLFASLA